MLKFSLAILFAMSLGTLTIAAAAMPVPPQVGASQITVADLG